MIIIHGTTMSLLPVLFLHFLLLPFSILPFLFRPFPFLPFLFLPFLVLPFLPLAVFLSTKIASLASFCFRFLSGVFGTLQSIGQTAEWWSLVGMDSSQGRGGLCRLLAPK